MMKKIDFRIDEKEFEKLKMLADLKGVTMSEIVRDIVLKVDELNDIKNYLRVGLNKNLYMTLRVLLKDDKAKVEEEYNKFKMQ